MTEIIFEVTEDEVDGGYSASAVGYGIHTQAIRWKRSAATCEKPWTATSIPRCSGRS